MKGWVYIDGATKWHYIVHKDGGRSLCGRWLFMGSPSVLVDDNHGSPDNCKLCRVRRDQKFKGEEHAADSLHGSVCDSHGNPSPGAVNDKD